MTVTNLVLLQGSGRPIRIPNVRDSAGTPITNWAEYSVKAQIRERVTSTTVLHEWTSQGAGANVSFDQSDIVLEIDHEVSSAWTWTRGRYDVELTGPAGIPDRIAEGNITISREVTR